MKVPRAIARKIAYIRITQGVGGTPWPGARVFRPVGRREPLDGHHRCARAANLVSARFWLGHGFRPIAYRLCQRLDERLVWARPRDHGA